MGIMSDLSLRLSANTGELKSGLADAKKSLNDFGKDAKTAASKITESFKDVGGATSSLKEMRIALRSLQNISFAGKSKEEINAINTEVGRLNRSIRDLKSKQSGGGGGLLSSLGGLMPFTLGVGALSAGIVGLASNMIKVRSEFEKYEAVLTNTLGSASAARMEMSMLKEFAASTPFQLNELTGAFVKLTNYGLKPSKDDLRRLGDIASSVGKGFDQLAEALADAVTGQFERLKEFGIKSKKEGENVTFTFKGQSKTILNNADAIKTYITGLGDLKGVYGSMAAISNTLGGRISNMKDSWDSLMNTMGSGNSGIFKSTIELLTSLTAGLDMAMKSIATIKREALDKAASSGIANGITEVDKTTKSLVANGMDQKAAQKRAFDLYKQSINETFKHLNDSFKKATGDQKTELGNRIQLLKSEYDGVKSHFNKVAVVVKESKSAYELITTSISDMEKKVKDVIASGGVATPQMLNGLNELYKKLEKANSEYEKMIKLSQGRDDSKFKPLKSLSANSVSGSKSNIGLETDKLKAFTKAITDSGNAQDKLFKKSQTGWNTIKAGITDTQFILESLKSGLDGITGAFTDLFAGTVGGFKNVVTSMLQGVQQIINALLAQAIAAMIAKESSKGLLGLAFAAVGVAGLIGLWKSQVPEFAMGGVVPGNSYSGDKVPVAVNSGEMILNGSQQARLFAMANGSNSSNGRGATVEFEIKGDKLVGVLNNYNKKMIRTR